MKLCHCSDEKRICIEMLNEVLNFILTEENIAQRVALETKAWQDFDKRNSVYLYGAGYLMQFYCRYLKKFGVNIAAILDTYKEGNYQGIPILQYDSFLRSAPKSENCRFFVASAAYAKDIIALLKGDFYSDNIFFVDHAFQLGIENMTLEQYRLYLTSNWKDIEMLYKNLSDYKSKITLLNILKEHISGNPDWLWDTLDLDLDYPKDVICFDKNEIFVEPGANNGNTFLEFVRRCPEYRAAYLFEPEACFQDRLREIAVKEQQRGKVVQIIQKGVWDKEQEMEFTSTEQGNGSLVLTSNTGSVVSIMTTTVDKAVPVPFTYMKMDIEGAEIKALKGAEKHILVNRPKLGISVYHKPTDLLDVWKYLRMLNPDYHFYLRNHTPVWDDIILYAV